MADSVLSLVAKKIQRLIHRARRSYTSSQHEVFNKLAYGVEYVCGADVVGDIAEFGTMTGKTATVLAQALAEFDHLQPEKKKLHLFDSFQGLPVAESPVDRDSPHVKVGWWQVGTCQGISKTKLVAMCQPFIALKYMRVYEGWFKDTLPNVKPGTQFALLHLDSDMYQSAVDVLEYCFSHRIVATGAVFLFDDWNCNQASPEFGERRAWQEMVARFQIKYSDGGDYGWAGHKLTVHSYGV